MALALSACVSGGLPGTGGGTTPGTPGGGTPGSGTPPAPTSKTFSGLGAFRTVERHTSGSTPEVDRSPMTGSPVSGTFVPRNGTTPPTITVTGMVSPTGEDLSGEYTGMMVAPTDDPSKPTFSEEYYAEGGKQIRLFHRLGDITPEHVALISYNASRGIYSGGVVDRNVQGHAVVGELTPVGNLPNGSSVLYNGKFTGQVASSSNGYNDGDASATVNFVGGTIAGKIWNPDSTNPEGTPEIAFTGELEGAQFHATSITATKDGKTTELGGAAGGALVGGIFGPAGEELGAAVNTPEVWADDNSDFFWVRGGIVAKKQ